MDRKNKKERIKYLPVQMTLSVFSKDLPFLHDSSTALLLKLSVSLTCEFSSYFHEKKNPDF